MVSGVGSTSKKGSSRKPRETVERNLQWQPSAIQRSTALKPTWRFIPVASYARSPVQFLHRPPVPIVEEQPLNPDPQPLAHVKNGEPPSMDESSATPDAARCVSTSAGVANCGILVSSLVLTRTVRDRVGST